MTHRSVSERERASNGLDGESQADRESYQLFARARNYGRTSGFMPVLPVQFFRLHSYNNQATSFQELEEEITLANEEYMSAVGHSSKLPPCCLF